MKNNYPWSNLQPGEGFFVPCVDVWRVREEGLKAAISLRLYHRPFAFPAIKQGALGVWFGLRQRVLIRRG
jgi:hypothetical protein